MECIPSMQDWFNVQNSINVVHHINSLKKKNHMVLSMDTENYLTKPTPTHNKNLISKLEIDGNCLHLMKTNYKNLQLKSYNGENLRTFLLRSGTKQGCPFSSLLFTIVLEDPGNAIRQENEKLYRFGKKK